ncbi:hypothetical protein EDD80_101607 [Anseongella ginsenosidimutans]|uniref:Uncharacterized protein n=1 Tax=Anseongella ginsenosidimutans TaxID=496056 RepID=A0A4R3KX55_9SPHI|nr:hypothetical protein EDD80_101607 [Anseongella ginsenosidimutans]
MQYSTEDRSAEAHFQKPEDGEGWKKVKEIDVMKI